ncbi:cobalt ECF transporter T component CbiQ [Gloeobacter kilaueensis]|uniref:Cobalt ABC transporter, inner membrane subunit CbiQ n=1 Tax=Gloeobacter kilaueensis (strain ATCC BAA-2537 / CCAP 1431/1 / ULC 316 / JS1) TaxID=1183438 RepID=U5QR11_GLOK1|nr:cobalt ECF transporter T component CbiQ [Gloeobacter kilaueensis]AGY60155.1 cobalt ABC transporter, inner membrane subunit CbiQ [Gloeobacter kilaueensis JS1]
MIWLHVPTFSLAACAQGDSFWHRLQPGVRLACTLLWVLGVVLLPEASWTFWGVYAAGLLVLVLVSGISPGTLVRRLAVELLFVGVLLLTILFSGRGAVLVQWGPLTIAAASLTTFLSVLVRAVLSLWLLNVLTLTTPAPNLLQALAGFGCPPLLVRVIESMLRYVAVFLDELGSMQRAAQARAGTRRLLRWQTLGNVLGAMFLRTYGRGERTYLAMQARGFTGQFLEDPTAGRWRWQERLITAATASFVAISLSVSWWPS